MSGCPQRRWAGSCGSPRDAAAPEPFGVPEPSAPLASARAPLLFSDPRAEQRLCWGAACAVSAASICFELMHLESKAEPPPRPHRGPPLLTSAPLLVPLTRAGEPSSPRVLFWLGPEEVYCFSSPVSGAVIYPSGFQHA